MNIFTLMGTIMVDNARANESISQTGQRAEGLTSKLGKGIATVGKFGLAIGGAVIAGATAIGALAMKSAETTDRIDKLSAKIGISKQAFQEWDYVLAQNGMSIETMQNGMKTLNKLIVDSANGNAEASKKFAELNIAILDANGALRNQDDIMRDTLKTLADLPNGADKSRLAVEMFGKAGLELMPMLNNGSASIDELTQKAHDLGLVMNDEAVSAGVLLGDTMDDVKRAFGAIVTKLGVEVMPVVQSFLEWILSAMPTIQIVVGGTFDILGKLIGGVAETINNLARPAFADLFQQSGEEANGFQAVMIALWEWLEPFFTDLQELVRVVLERIKAIWEEHGTTILAIIQPIFENAKLAISSAMEMIRAIIRLVTALIKGDWERAWNALKDYVQIVFETIKTAIGNYLEAIINIFVLTKDLFLQAGKNIFNAVWDGMKFVWNKINSWVSDKVNWLIDKLAFWRSGQNEMAGGNAGGSFDGSHFGGLSYVPFDGYIAQLHKGERVLTAKENEKYNTTNNDKNINLTINIDNFNNGGQGDMEDLARELAFYIQRKTR